MSRLRNRTACTLIISPPHKRGYASGSLLTDIVQGWRTPLVARAPHHSGHRARRSRRNIPIDRARVRRQSSRRTRTPTDSNSPAPLGRTGALPSFILSARTATSCAIPLAHPVQAPAHMHTAANQPHRPTHVCAQAQPTDELCGVCEARGTDDGHSDTGLCEHPCEHDLRHHHVLLLCQRLRDAVSTT